MRSGSHCRLQTSWLLYRGLLGDSPLLHVPIRPELISMHIESSRCIVRYQSVVIFICLHTDVRIIIWYSSGAYPPMGNMAVLTAQS